MLEKLRELSIKLWEPIGNIFYYLFDSSNIWVPIIGFFITSFLSLYIIRKLLDIFVELPLIKIFQVVIKFILKIFVFLIFIGIFVSLSFYIHFLYTEHEKEVVKREQSVDYLLR